MNVSDFLVFRCYFIPGEFGVEKVGVVIVGSLFSPMLFSLVHMNENDCSIPFSILFPSVVRENTFRGRSWFVSHWLVMYPFSCSSARKG